LKHGASVKEKQMSAPKARQDAGIPPALFAIQFVTNSKYLARSAF
jgi:hypothetical protein